MLVFDAGNTLWSNVVPARNTGGKIIVEAMNIMGYTAATLGEKDLLLGEKTLRKRMSEARFPILSANVFGSNGKLLARPYVVLKTGDLRVGILGLTGTALPQEVKLKVKDPLAAAGKYIPVLKKKSDFVVVLAHLGPNGVRDLVEAFPDVDLVVWGKPSAPIRPLWDEEHRTLAVSAEAPSPGHAGRKVGVTRLELDGEGRILEYHWKTVSLTPDFADHPEILKLLEKYR